ncbi:hypothetical protein [Methylopila sp. M107]|uniref:hypothetical protein n=1 Tax=Methylopila sp. M107 TaxID=1101190 RepID=UPI0003606230|nr:hypothetical protein [Methylopila sp. M107]
MFEKPDERIGGLMRQPFIAQAAMLIALDALRLAYANLGEAAVLGERRIDGAFFAATEAHAISKAIRDAPLLEGGENGTPSELVPSIVECARYIASAAFERTRQEHVFFGLDL